MENTQIVAAIIEFAILIYLFYNVIQLQKKVKDLKNNTCYKGRKAFKTSNPEIRVINSPEDLLKTLLDKVMNNVELTLEEELKIALDNEDYVLASKIKQQIEAKKNGEK
ncbi:UvrB/UvrC motif-containing protein [Polaribacter aestuariivivens]|uniref:UvrB/UvrC motif-containing protein n=1 Tax=Polaribacter aestuariivivens TaxID=2304626 RepID=UPI003F494C92